MASIPDPELASLSTVAQLKRAMGDVKFDIDILQKATTEACAMIEGGAIEGKRKLERLETQLESARAFYTQRGRKLMHLYSDSNKPREAQAVTEEIEETLTTLEIIEKNVSRGFITAAQADEEQRQGRGNARGERPEKEWPQMKLAEKMKPSFLLEEGMKWQDVETWTEAFIRYHKIGQIHLLDPEYQRGLFQECVERSFMEEIKNELKPGMPAYRQYDDECMVAVARLRILAATPLKTRRNEYLSIVQNPGEEHIKYLARSKASSKHAEMDKITEEDLLMIVIIKGSSDSKLKMKWLETANLNYDKARQVVIEYVGNQKSARELTPGHSGGSTSTVSAAQIQARNADLKTIEQFKKHYKGRCFRCGSSDHRGDNASCKARSINCTNCQKTGHFARMCMSGLPSEAASRGGSRDTSRASSRQPSRERDRERSSSKGRESSASASARAVTICRVSSAINADTPRLSARFTTRKGASFARGDVLPDTGATRSILAESLIKEQGIKVERKEDLNIQDAQGKPMDYVGTVRLEVESPGYQKIEIDALVARGLKEGVLLSWQDMQKMGIISRDFPAPPSSGAHARALKTDKPATDEEKRRNTEDSVKGLREINGQSATPEKPD